MNVVTEGEKTTPIYEVWKVLSQRATCVAQEKSLKVEARWN